MSVITISKALHAALREEMTKDQAVFVIGEDIGGQSSPYGVARDLETIFGKNRVIATPLSEAGYVGISIGASMRGMRPVIEFASIDFIGVCMDQIINQAAKMRYMSGGQVSVPIVLHLPIGSGLRKAGQHSQCLESMLAHLPGLKIVAPTTPYDAKGLFKAAIRDDDPVVFLTHKFLFDVKGEVSEDDYIIPIGEATIRREGKDVTIIAWSRQVLYSLEAAEKLQKEGIDAEVLDLRSLVPLDWETIAESVCKTHRVVVTEECVKRGGYAGEISAQIAEELFTELYQPVARVGALNIVPPFSPPLEDAFFPHPQDIVDAAEIIMSKPKRRMISYGVFE
jgi:pyruvate/2-oxoglutarate/acetoin dehydrogenase E1 component